MSLSVNSKYALKLIACVTPSHVELGSLQQSTRLSFELPCMYDGSITTIAPKLASPPCRYAVIPSMRSVSQSPLMSAKPQYCVDRSINCARVSGVISPVGCPSTQSPTPHRLGVDCVDHWGGISVARSLTCTTWSADRICTGAENGYNEIPVSPPLSNGPTRLYTPLTPVAGSSTMCFNCPCAVAPLNPDTVGFARVSVSFTPPASLNITST